MNYTALSIVTLLFVVVSSPTVYRITQSIFGRVLHVSDDGRPTFAGVVLHGVVFFLLVLALGGTIKL